LISAVSGFILRSRIGSQTKTLGFVTMGFFTDEELRSLRISNMILQVVGKGNFSPANSRPVEHESFFIERIRDTDVSPVFDFSQESRTKLQIEKIANRTDTFEKGSQNLAYDFCRLHVGSTREGAFFIFELETDDINTRIYSLIKYDFSEAIEQFDENGESLLRRIVNAFIADRKAIQKSALIRVVMGVADFAVSATDRSKNAPDIGDYFEKYLDVNRTRSNEELSRKVVDVLSNVLRRSQNRLPNGDVAAALRRAKGALRDRQEISEDAIQDAILAGAGNPEDEDVRAELHSRTRLRIKAEKLEGLSFPPDRKVLRRPAMRKLSTTEGITIIYPDEPESTTLHRDPQQDGGEIITIRTSKIEDDTVVSERAR
jgi:hypothetical protein